jgi:hypothetical protein
VVSFLQVFPTNSCIYFLSYLHLPNAPLSSSSLIYYLRIFGGIEKGIVKVLSLLFSALSIYLPLRLKYFLGNFPALSQPMFLYMMMMTILVVVVVVTVMVMDAYN